MPALDDLKKNIPDMEKTLVQFLSTAKDRAKDTMEVLGINDMDARRKVAGEKILERLKALGLVTRGEMEIEIQKLTKRIDALEAAKVAPAKKAQPKSATSSSQSS